MHNKYINLKKIEKIINSSSHSLEEKEELWKIVEEIVHHRLMTCALDNLDKKHHQDFLNKYSLNRFNEEIIDYLEKQSGKQMRTKLKEEIDSIEKEILLELNLN